MSSENNEKFHTDAFYNMDEKKQKEKESLNRANDSIRYVVEGFGGFEEFEDYLNKMITSGQISENDDVNDFIKTRTKELRKQNIINNDPALEAVEQGIVELKMENGKLHLITTEKYTLWKQQFIAKKQSVGMRSASSLNEYYLKDNHEDGEKTTEEEDKVPKNFKKNKQSDSLEKFAQS
ncbi:MAG TPA: hypothetical protein P5230_01995 [Candidatus Magasanikbacteria bacterium]|nr:hypothetical protein [Candidatus Magasanikbacteria bacterium]